MESQLERIKKNLSIAQAWHLLDLPGQPAKECRSPFRDDKRPSFSVYRQGAWERWFDHALGEGGDVVDFWAKAKNLSIPEAISDLIGVVPSLGLDSSRFGAEKDKYRAHTQGTLKSIPSEIFWSLDLRPPTVAECCELSALRHITPEAFFLAGCLGTLKISQGRHRIWMITDEYRRCAEVRRFDGLPFLIGGKECKGLALKHSEKDWPLGLKTLNSDFDRLQNILLLEGQPDYYAGLALAIQSPISFRPMTMLGTMHLAKEVAPHFRGKNVVILPHTDKSGKNAGHERALQVRAFGAAKIVVQPVSFIHNDLNDVLRFSSDEALQLLKGFQCERSPHA